MGKLVANDFGMGRRPQKGVDLKYKTDTKICEVGYDNEGAQFGFRGANIASNHTIEHLDWTT